MPTILSSPFFVELVLPFLLVFTVVFAILDKSKILGEGKRQINAIVAFVVALIFVAFSDAVGLSIQLIAVMAVVIVIMLVFMILYAFSITGEKEFTLPKGVKWAFLVLIVAVIVISLLIFTGYWPLVLEALSGGEGSSLVMNLLFLIIIGVAIAIVVRSGEGGGGGES